MSRPRNGMPYSATSYDFGYAQPLVSDGEASAPGFQLSANLSLLYLAVQTGNFPNGSRQGFAALKIGLGFGPLSRVPITDKPEFFARAELLGVRFRGGGGLPYSSVELGFGQHITRNFGAFISVEGAYPGISLFPYFPKREESGHQDGFNAFMHVGLVFAPGDREPVLWKIPETTAPAEAPTPTPN